jgi:hypothetical protein
MSQPVQRPTKEQVRFYTEQRRAANTPPPEPDEIRRQLGWAMLGQGKVDEPQR